jgi:hypothetical protein
MINNDSFVGGAGRTVKVTGSFEGRNIVGLIELDQAGTNPGDPVMGEIDIKIIETHGGFRGRR